MNTTRATDARALRERLQALVNQDDVGVLETFLAELHPSDIADVVESLGEGARLEALRTLPSELASETLAEMEEGEARVLLAALGPAEGAELLQELPVDDAADLVGDLKPEDRDRILAEFQPHEAGEIRDLLQYGEETAGGIMNTALVSVLGTLTAGEAIDAVRQQGREVEDFYTVFVVDDAARLLGTVPLDDLILADTHEPVRRLVEPIVAWVTPDQDQEDVGHLIHRYDLVSIPVVSDDRTLLGRITFDDVIDVLEGRDDRGSAPLLRCFRRRGASREPEGCGDSAASLAATQHDDGQLRRYGGVGVPGPDRRRDVACGCDAGCGRPRWQCRSTGARRDGAPAGYDGWPFGEPGPRDREGTLRRTAERRDYRRGGGCRSGGAGRRRGGTDPFLGLVVLLAMWGNIAMAGFAGSFIPSFLHRRGQDPAVASTVFLTALTDMTGFLLLLGLATAML